MTGLSLTRRGGVSSSSSITTGTGVQRSILKVLCIHPKLALSVESTQPESEPTMPSPTQTSVRDLLDHYDTFFLDAYGVLVTGRGALQGAAPFIELLRSQQKSFSIVTNDASRLPSTCAARYQELGIQIDAHEVLTSGSMITEVFKEQALAGAKTMVLGTDDTLHLRH